MVEGTELITAPYDRVADVYDATYQTPVAQAENLLVRELIKAHTIPEGPLLDLGCGTGFLLDLIEGLPLRTPYVGVDLSAAMLARAARKYPGVAFAHCDMLEACYNFPPGWASTVMGLWSASYFPQPVKLVEGIARVLKQGVGWTMLIFYGAHHPGSYAFSLHGEQPPEMTRYTRQVHEELLASWPETLDQPVVQGMVPIMLPDGGGPHTMLTREEPWECKYVIVTAETKRWTPRWTPR